MSRDTKESFGDVLQALRGRSRHTQVSLAALLRVSKKTISRWELGETRPDQFQAHFLVATLGDVAPDLRDRIALSLGVALARQAPVDPEASKRDAAIRIAALDAALFEAAEILGAPLPKTREAMALVIRRVALLKLDLEVAAQLISRTS